MTQGRSAFVDESSWVDGLTQRYLICATVLSAKDQEMLRPHLSKFLLPGQVKFHWSKESRARRLKVLELIATLENLVVVVSHVGEIRRNDERYRRKCLETLYSELEIESVANVVLENRSTRQDLSDRKHILALQSSGRFKMIRMTHASGSSEPLVWISDSVLGALHAAETGDPEILTRLAGIPVRRITAAD